MKTIRNIIIDYYFVAHDGDQEMAGILSGKEIDVPNEVKNVLQFDEKVICGYQQAGIGGKITGLESIFATDRRLIKMNPKTLGLRADVTDYLFKDMANVKMDKGILRSSIRIVMRFNSEPVDIENIPKDGAERLFKIIQDGIAGKLAGKPTNLTDTEVSASQINIVDKIKQLKELKDNGLISEEEFLKKKKDFLDKM